MRYDYDKLRRVLEEEYMAAMVVGFSEDTPDLTDLQYASGDWLVHEAKRLGFDLAEFEVEDVEESGEGSAQNPGGESAEGPVS